MPATWLYSFKFTFRSAPFGTSGGAVSLRVKSSRVSLNTTISPPEY